LAQAAKFGKVWAKESMHPVAWLDYIIIFLVLALVVGRVFRFKLPSDSRNKAARKAEYDQLFGRRKPTPAAPSASAEPAEPDTAEAAPAPKPSRRKAPLALRDVAHLEGLEQIKALDPNSDLAQFLEGAIAAYSYFYECYNARDQEGIINLCGPQFEQEVLAQWQSNPAKIILEAEPQATVHATRLNGRTAVVEVLFRADHRVGKAAPHAVRALWVFARAVASPDPNWELQTIKPQADA